MWTPDPATIITAEAKQVAATAAMFNTYRTAIQSHIDATAQQKQYDSGATLASYVNSTVSQWAAEATAFVAWRDQVWAYALTELDKVTSAAREQPTIETFLADLPPFEWLEI